MLGSIFAISSAFFWAIAVIMFKKCGEVFSPISLNLYKSLVAAVLLVLIMIILNIPFFPERPMNDWLLLALSGFVGITLADMFFFMSLNRLGAGLVAIVECFYLPSVILFSFILLGEQLSPQAAIGGIMVLSAVFIGPYTKKRTSRKKNKTEKKDLLIGIITGCISVILLAVGIVMIKEILEQTDVFWATFVRVAAGIVSLLIIVVFHPKRKQYLDELKFSRAWIVVLPASVCGNFIALLFWVAGMKYTTASQAGILNQMSTIFIFILAAVFLKEKITVNRSIAIAVAVTGACLTIFG